MDLNATHPAATATIEAARARADDLIRDLAQHVGDDEAVRATMIRWLDRLDATALGIVCMAAMRRTFADCLIPTTRENWPAAGGHRFAAPEGENQ